MTIAVDLGRKATKQTNKQTILCTVNFSFRMRDLSNQEKQENQKLTKQSEKLTTDSNIVKKERDRLQTEVNDLHEQMIELKEQVRELFEII